MENCPYEEIMIISLNYRKLLETLWSIDSLCASYFVSSI